MALTQKIKRVLFLLAREFSLPRYFASKLWQGENYFMQIDAHSLFQIGWDAMLIQDIVK